MRDVSGRDALYAEWRAMDRAREAAKVAPPAPETLTEPAGGVSVGIGRNVVQEGEVAPRASQEVLGPARCGCHTQPFPDGLFTSVRTGRDYLPHVTPRGISFGWEQRTKYVHITAAGYTLEKSTSGHRQIDMYVDELEAKLKGRAKGVASIKEHLRKPEHHATLDEWLQRSLRFPCRRKRAQRQLSKFLDALGLKAPNREELNFIFYKQAFWKTWDK